MPTTSSPHLREPRGYPAAKLQSRAALEPSEADAGFVIMEQVEYPPMSAPHHLRGTVLIEPAWSRPPSQ